MEKRWTLKERAEESAIKELSASLNSLHPVLCELLIHRGVTCFDQAKSFFRPSLSELHDPFLMKDMDNAVERLQDAIEKKEKILIYGDYDVDGTTSVSLLYRFLIKHYENIDYYIPDRYSEGYGISFQGIDFAENNGFSLIIALDCGIKAVDKIAYASEKKIDFIICDHHRPGNILPQAVAVLDPKREDCPYPFKELSGCGVGFKFMQAFSRKANIPEEDLLNLLDLLAISICADIVPIVDENRILTFHGIRKLENNPLPGIKAMMEIANLKKKEITVTDVVFSLAPRINAAGRIESGKNAVEVLISNHPEIATEKSAYIDGHNSDRKQLDKSITEQALEMIHSDPTLISRKTTCLFKEDWHKGVIGIVASRCIESFYRPTIILTESNGMAAGSARSVKGFDIYNAIEECSDLIEQFGGHKYAAGLTIKKENIPKFQEKFEEVVAASIHEDLLKPEIVMDCEIRLSDIQPKFYRVLKQFSPSGPGNMRPVFCVRNVTERGYARIVGNGHLKMEIVDPENQDIFYPCIGFGLGEKMEMVQKGNRFDAVFVIEENEWNGNVSLQLLLKDIRPAEKESLAPNKMEQGSTQVHNQFS